MNCLPEIELEPIADNNLKSFLLQTGDCKVDAQRRRSNCFRLMVTEPSGCVHEITFCSDGELAASITSE